MLSHSIFRHRTKHPDFLSTKEIRKKVLFLNQHSIVQMEEHFIHIDDRSPVPKYQQVINCVKEAIRNGLLAKGQRLPSINEICEMYPVARETIVKAYDRLKEEGIIESVKAKGFYVARTKTEDRLRILLILDTFTIYRELLYDSIIEYLGDRAAVDLDFHHSDIHSLESLLNEKAGKYHFYIILPFEHERMQDVLDILPRQKLYLVNRFIKGCKERYAGIYQDFKNDIYAVFVSIANKVRKYHHLVFVFRPSCGEVPREAVAGFEKFCKKEKISYEVMYRPFSGKVKKGEGYVVVDDDDLVAVILSAREQQLETGSDVGVISYNESSLKKIIGNGISVISTDFYLMGKKLVQMMLDGKRECLIISPAFNDRGSF